MTTAVEKKRENLSVVVKSFSMS